MRYTAYRVVLSLSAIARFSFIIIFFFFEEIHMAQTMEQFDVEYTSSCMLKYALILFFVNLTISVVCFHILWEAHHLRVQQQLYRQQHIMAEFRLKKKTFRNIAMRFFFFFLFLHENFFLCQFSVHIQNYILHCVKLSPPYQHNRPL